MQKKKIFFLCLIEHRQGRKKTYKLYLKYSIDLFFHFGMKGKEKKESIINSTLCIRNIFHSFQFLHNQTTLKKNLLGQPSGRKLSRYIKT